MARGEGAHARRRRQRRGAGAWSEVKFSVSSTTAASANSIQQVLMSEDLSLMLSTALKVLGFNASVVVAKDALVDPSSMPAGEVWALGADGDYRLLACPPG